MDVPGFDPGIVQAIHGTEDQDTVLTYPSSSLDRERMIELIKSVGKWELMREARVGTRTIEAAWNARKVAEENLKRMAAAAERVASGGRKREDEQATAIAWLKMKREEVGLTRERSY